MTDKARQIAAGLSFAMREALTHPENGDYFWCADRRTENAAERRGLIAGLTINGCRRWTHLGLAVRKYLQEKQP